MTRDVSYWLGCRPGLGLPRRAQALITIIVPVGLPPCLPSTHIKGMGSSSFGASGYKKGLCEQNLCEQLKEKKLLPDIKRCRRR